MKLGPRIKSSIEILEIIFNSHIPADNQITNYFRARKYIGAHDRRFISQLVYSVLRNYFQILWYAQETSWGLKNISNKARNFMLIYLTKIEKDPIFENCLNQHFCREQYHPEPVNGEEKMYLMALSTVNQSSMPVSVRCNVPQEFFDLLAPLYENSQDLEKLALSLSSQACFDLRINTLKTSRKEVLKELAKQGIDAKPTPYSPLGVRLNDRRPMPDNPLWKSGNIEVQDEGSQILGLLVDAKYGMTVLDMCAGAGGKTLVIGMQMENRGQIFATDISLTRLTRAKERIRRAGLHNISCKHLDPKGLQWLNRQPHRFDRLLIDAPCTGTGTWRRNPDQKYKFSLQTLEELVAKQREILTQAQPLVKTGGRLIYATCSLLPQENIDQINWFLKQYPDWVIIPWKNVDCGVNIPGLMDSDTLQLNPFIHETDGFFAAILEKR